MKLEEYGHFPILELWFIPGDDYSIISNCSDRKIGLA